MEKVLQIILGIHIAAGTISLIVAPIAMMVKKGGKQHRLWGKVYFAGMTIVVITAIIISLYKTIPFLLMIAVFGYYFIVSGYRALFLKKLHAGQRATIIDWSISLFASLFNMGLIIWGIVHLIGEKISSFSSVSFSVISIVLGVLGMTFVIGNIKGFFKLPKDKNQWFFNHMVGMLAGYLVTLGAFSAVNFYFLPTIIRWLWPVILGVPAIIIWTKYYERKFNKGKQVKEIVTLEINVDNEN
ncbi:DUF2306 domain-containing protein [Candidatus Amoebophilus asiaticus]|nr:DUF2306 domain-containing protein [Candidatus Amoebophilus asiaticus]